MNPFHSSSKRTATDACHAFLKAATKWSDNSPASKTARKAQQECWENIFRQGDRHLIANAVQAGIHPDRPFDANYPTALSALMAFSHDDDQLLYEAALMALELIDNGATLTQRDYRGLLPADYALFSPNPKIPAIVIPATLRHIERHHLGIPLVPAIHGFFATQPGFSMRESAFLNLACNLPIAVQSIDDAMNPHTHSRIALTPDLSTLAYWKALPCPKWPDLPETGMNIKSKFLTLTLAEQTFADKKTQQNENAVTEALHALRYEQWKSARNWDLI